MILRPNARHFYFKHYFTLFNILYVTPIFSCVIYNKLLRKSELEARDIIEIITPLRLRLGYRLKNRFQSFQRLRLSIKRIRLPFLGSRL